jgi:hypothetical protein
VKVKTSSNAASNQQHASYDHQSYVICDYSQDTYDGTTGGEMAAAIEL